MADNISEKFIAALKELEANSRAENIVALFSDDCEVGNVALTESLTGTDGAREFWTNYRKTFKDVSSEFKNIITTDGRSALEWTTTGSSEAGHDINYEGVSILETDGEKISRFFAYFDPKKLGDQIME